MPSKYDKMTQEEFDDILSDLVNQAGSDVLMSIPGIYEIVSEHFNNDVLDAWEEKHADEIAEEQERIDDQTGKCCPHCGASYEGFGCICDDDLVEP